jgi:hypothetical protein
LLTLRGGKLPAGGLLLLHPLVRYFLFPLFKYFGKPTFGGWHNPPISGGQAKIAPRQSHDTTNPMNESVNYIR